MASAPAPGYGAGPADVPSLDFHVDGASALASAALPTLELRLGVSSADARPIRGVTLTTQIRIAALRRPYDPATRARLAELFGDPARWGVTLRSVSWMQTVAQVPPFTGSTVVALPVTCSYDFELTVVRYFAALPDGDVPLELLFSGTVFWSTDAGLLQAARLPWDREATFRLPVATWREVIDRYFPHSAWLRLDRDVFDRLWAYRSRHALPSWDVALDALLRGAEEA